LPRLGLDKLDHRKGSTTRKARPPEGLDHQKGSTTGDERKGVTA